MTDQFSAARLKIDRAEKHISDLDGAIQRLQEGYTCVIEQEPELRGNMIKYEIVDQLNRSIEIALIAGDAIHNLKAALDFSWVGALSRIGLQSNKYTKFPVAETIDELKSMLGSRKIASVSPALYALVLDEIQPYTAGRFFVHDLHRLDIADKHKLIIPIVSYGGVSGIAVQDESTGEIRRGDTYGFPINGGFHVDFDNSQSIKDTGKLSVSVMFGKGDGADGFPVIDMLRVISAQMKMIVRQLETFPIV